MLHRQGIIKNYKIYYKKLKLTLKNEAMLHGWGNHEVIEI